MINNTPESGFKPTRGLFIIAARNEAPRIASVITGCQQYGFPVWVVDDASRDETAEIATTLGAHVIKLDHHHGKTSAIRQALLQLPVDIDWFVLLDGDQQHDPDDFPLFLKQFHNGADHVIGNRLWKPDSIPMLRRWTNRFMSWLISKKIHQSIPDTQCGYRLIRRSSVGSWIPVGDHYSLETELTLHLSSVQAKTNSIPIKVIYHPDGQSGIRWIRDTFAFIKVITQATPLSAFKFKHSLMRLLSLLLFFGLSSITQSATIKEQLLVAIPDQWTSTKAMLHRYEKENNKPWEKVGPAMPALLGHKGLAWGIGLHKPQQGVQKKEGDGKAPAGLFKVGFAMGYPPSLPSPNKGWPYHQVTDKDAWIDNPALPNYNHLYTLPPNVQPPKWFESQRKRLGDPAYHWKILIEHNYMNPQYGAGSAIFFHIRRGPKRATFGCTTLAKEDIETLMKWLDPKAKTLYALLPKEEYARFKTEWNLPPLPHSSP